MVATKEYIEELRQTSRINIDASLEAYILSEYGEEPFPHTWSSQDLYEQIRKLVIVYESGKLHIDTISPVEQLARKHEALKVEYIDLLYELVELVETLKRHGIDAPKAALSKYLPFD